jgi:ribosomal protein S8E
VVEFQALGAVQRYESHAGLAFKLIGVTDQRGGIEEIGEGLSGFDALGEGPRQLFEVFQARYILWSVAVLEHGHVAGFIENGMQESRRFLIDERILQFADELLECAQGSYRPAGRSTGDKFLDGCPQRRSINACRFAERVQRRLADAAWGNVQHAEQRDIILRMHGQTYVGKGVLHFGAIVETEPTHQFVAQPAAAENLFEGARLKIGAVFDGARLV